MRSPIVSAGEHFVRMVRQDESDVEEECELIVGKASKAP